MKIPALLSFLLIFCSHAFAEEVTVGLIAELTGDYARTGKDCVRGFELARKLHTKSDSLPNVKLNFITGDSAGAAGTGLSEFKRMTEAGGASLVILTRSVVALSVNPVSLTKKIPILAVASHPKITTENRFAFRFYPSGRDEGSVLAMYTLMQAKTAAIITTEDDFNLALGNVFKDEFQKGGGKVIFSETVLPSEVNFNTIAAKINSKAPEAILINVSPQQVGVLTKKLREVGIKSKLVSNFYMGLPDTRKVAGEAAIGAAYSQVHNDYPQFVSEFLKLFPAEKTSPIAFSCFAALSTGIQSISQISGPVNKDTIYSALSALNEIEISGKKIPMKDQEAKLPIEIKFIEN